MEQAARGADPQPVAAASMRMPVDSDRRHALRTDRMPLDQGAAVAAAGGSSPDGSCNHKRSAVRTRTRTRGRRSATVAETFRGQIPLAACPGAAHPRRAVRLMPIARHRAGRCRVVPSPDRAHAARRHRLALLRRRRVTNADAAVAAIHQPINGGSTMPAGIGPRASMRPFVDSVVAGSWYGSAVRYHPPGFARDGPAAPRSGAFRQRSSHGRASGSIRPPGVQVLDLTLNRPATRRRRWDRLACRHYSCRTNPRAVERIARAAASPTAGNRYRRRTPGTTGHHRAGAPAFDRMRMPGPPLIHRHRRRVALLSPQPALAGDPVTVAIARDRFIAFGRSNIDDHGGRGPGALRRGARRR